MSDFQNSSSSSVTTATTATTADAVTLTEDEKNAKTTGDKYKDEGNKYLASNKLSLACDKYTEAIDTYPNEAIYYANRSQVYIKMECYGLAIADANIAIALNSSYTKAYYRRASANFALGKTKDALKDLNAVVKIAPRDPDIAKKLKACKDSIREAAFQKAIESDNDSEQAIDVNGIVVESTYTGVKLESNSDNVPNITMDFVMETIQMFKEQKKLHRKYVIQILIVACEYFKTLPSLLRLSLPVDSDGNVKHFSVCGDTHGQFYDLCNIFTIGGFPSATNPFLFNGDFVDRGSFSFENVMTLMLIKLACPDGLFMLRGNHETKNMNKIYGFEGEVKHKYDCVVMKLFTKVFNNLPLAAVIQDAVFVVHGGLTTQIDGGMTLDAVNSIKRDREPPESGLMSDLLWSDPQPFPGKMPSKRGVGFGFGPDYTRQFLEKNNLKLLVRSHEVKQEGYVQEHDNGSCITIFSAPNYCDSMGNMGAYIRFYEDMTPHFTQFAAVPHPDVPPMAYASSLAM